MSGHRDDAAGPVVQKRDVFFVTGLLVSWVVVVYVLVHAAKNQSQPAKSHPSLQARQMDFIEEETPELLSQEAITTVFKSMKDRPGEVERPFGTLITAEPAPPALMENGTLMMEQNVAREIDQEAGGVDDAQEGELLEPETPEPAAPSLMEQPAPTLEPIKS